MTNVFFATKQIMSEAYLGETRVAVTRLDIHPMKVAAVKEKSIQVVFGKGKKTPSRAITGHLKSSGAAAGTIREIPLSEGDQVGQTLSHSDTVKAGTLVSVQGTTKGKGYAGVMKRWNFSGGPKTHGQSDRHRAPGSIGQGTTPGRVHRGKKMAGHMGTDTLTVKNLMVVAVDGNSIWVTGPVPGARKSLIKLMVTGQKDAPTLSFLNGYNPQNETPAQEPIVETSAEPAPEETKE